MHVCVRKKIMTNITNSEDSLSQENARHITRWFFYLSAGPIPKLYSTHIAF